MIKQSIFKTFLYGFLASLISILVVIYTLAVSSRGFYQVLMSHWRASWIIFSVSALLSLAFTVLTYLSQRRLIRQFNWATNLSLKGDLTNNQDLNKLVLRIRNLTQQLQEASREDTVRQVDIVTEERKRISRELHDSVSQQLFAATMILSGVVSNKNLDTEQMTTQARLVLKILHEAQNEMRALLLHLRPVELNGKSLIDGITSLVDELQAKISGKISWVYDTNIKLSKTVEDNIFRIMQELLSNALRHSKAQNIDISLLASGRSVILRVEDDGVGFDTKETKTASYGLKNIRERSVLLGGDVKIVSAPNQGTSIEIRIPQNEHKSSDS
ncbi:sensor histidine kinase [Streptococcaceae bacterium ESL0729]|nr:sensor histidine kinase [Streptococcaceae bacterium ESL0729]